MKLGVAAWFGEGDGTVKKKRRNFEEKKSPRSSVGMTKVKERKSVERRIKRSNLSHTQTVRCFTTVRIKMHSTGAIIDKQSTATEES